MSSPDEKTVSSELPSSDEARQVIEGYANDLREIIKKLRKKS
jgi:hypothetical protein